MATPAAAPRLSVGRWAGGRCGGRDVNEVKSVKCGGVADDGQNFEQQQDRKSRRTGQLRSRSNRPIRAPRKTSMHSILVSV